MGAAKRIVICGGGAIGASIAYFLSRRGARPIVVERHAVAGAASGKSGGFLALDWCRGTPLDAAGAAQLRPARRTRRGLGNPWGYRRLDDLCRPCRRERRGAQCGARPWLSDGWRSRGGWARRQTTALVEPRAFTTGLMRAAEAEGAELRTGTVATLVRGAERSRRRRRARQRRDRRGRRRGHRYGAVVDPGDALAAAARGVRLQGPQPGVPRPASHSRGGAVPRIPGGQRRGPDARAVSARRRHDLGVRGLGDAALPIDPAEVVADDGAHARLEAMCRTISPALAATEDRGAPGVLPAGHRGRAAADRRGAGRRRRLRGDRATASGAC